MAIFLQQVVLNSVRYDVNRVYCLLQPYVLSKLLKSNATNFSAAKILPKITLKWIETNT